MYLAFTLETEAFAETFEIRKAENCHFDQRACQRLHKSGEDILWELFFALKNDSWLHAWSVASEEMKAKQEIVIKDRTLGVAIPIVPEYLADKVVFTVKTIDDDFTKTFFPHDGDYVFDIGNNGIWHYSCKRQTRKPRRTYPRLPVHA